MMIISYIIYLVHPVPGMHTRLCSTVQSHVVAIVWQACMRMTSNVRVIIKF